MDAVRNAAQALPFPLRLRPLRPPSESSEAGRPALPPWSLPPPSERRDRLGEVEGVLHVGSREVSPPPSLRSVGGERGSGGWGGGGLWLLRVQAIPLLPPSRGRE